METFTVRVWTPAAAERPEGLRGTALHLGSGRQITFTEPGSLIEFLGEAAGPGDPLRPATRVPPSATQPGHEFSRDQGETR